ncbi:MAG: hypothetical protein EOM20_18170 [Spartobacteria bacterium]|nr:hypothetical protein [Spartobacteria bacterium]
MMKVLIFSLGVIGWLMAAFVPVSSRADDGLLVYEFEEDEQGWEVDWGEGTKINRSKSESNKGAYSLRIRHQFKQGSDNIGIRVPLEQTMDFSSQPDFLGFSAWVYFPKGAYWQAQIYVLTGFNWSPSWGKLNIDLKPGWHRLVIERDDIADLSLVKGIGVQIKNYELQTHAYIFIDSIKADFAVTQPTDTDSP